MKISNLSIPRRPVTRSRTSSIPRLGLHRFICSGLTPKRHFVGEEVVGDAHFISIGVAGEAEQSGLLRLPAEPADALASRGHIDDPGSAAADAVAVTVVRVFQGEDRLVGDRLDEPGAEERDGSAPGNHVRLGRNLQPGSDEAASRTGGTACRRSAR